MTGKHLEKKVKNKGKNQKAKNSSERKEEKRKKAISLNLFSILVLFIFLGIFIYSLITIISWIKSNYGLAKIEEDLLSKVVNIDNEAGTEKDNKQNTITINFDELESINSDVKAWIRIENTDINYPILQTKDNEFYLKHDIYKKYSSCGSIFLNYHNASDFSDDNTTVYGHNLKNQKMFADLSKIYKGELGNKIDIDIYTKESNKKYEIITAYMEDPNSETATKKFSKKDKATYVNSNIKKSKIKFEHSYSEEKKLLTLATCDSTGKKRIIITSCEK